MSLQSEDVVGDPLRPLDHQIARAFDDEQRQRAVDVQPVRRIGVERVERRTQAVEIRAFACRVRVAPQTFSDLRLRGCPRRRWD